LEQELAQDLQDEQELPQGEQLCLPHQGQALI
jgi:hypothetical protein